MKALILNSGIGKRMGFHTRSKPKCLIEISSGTTILSRQIDGLASAGITEYFITTGPFPGMIENYCKKLYPEFTFSYIYNPDFATTNSIYSFYLTNSVIDDDLLILHGDLIFDNTLCNTMISNSEKNCALVNASVPLPEKDFKARIKNNIITEISVSLFDNNCLFLLPFYKITQYAYLLWIREIERFIQRGEKNVYAENAFNNISSGINLRPQYIKKELCMEIDTPEDLQIAQNIIKKLNI